MSGIKVYLFNKVPISSDRLSFVPFRYLSFLLLGAWFANS